MHEVGHAGHATRGDRQGLDRVGRRLRRRRDGHRSGVVDVEQQPHRHAALLRVEDRGEHERSGSTLDPQVVEGEVEALAGAVDERRHLAGHVGRRLPAVGERRQLDGHAGWALPLRCAAL